MVIISYKCQVKIQKIVLYIYKETETVTKETGWEEIISGALCRERKKSFSEYDRYEI